MNARQYREKLYRDRAHPSEASPRPQAKTQHIDQSALRVYLSAIVFIAAEYYVAIALKELPTGVMFPVSFLMAWVVYYTYYAPTALDESIKTHKLDITNAPILLFNISVWSIKSVLEIASEFILKSETELLPQEKTQPSQTINFCDYKSKNAQTDPPLPQAIQISLQTLGIPNSRCWAEIQSRYRLLAKAYHPDLNPEITSNGNRFMQVDNAYRNLEVYRKQYFK